MLKRTFASRFLFAALLLAALAACSRGPEPEPEPKTTESLVVIAAPEQPEAPVEFSKEPPQIGGDRFVRVVEYPTDYATEDPSLNVSNDLEESPHPSFSGSAIGLGGAGGGGGKGGFAVRRSRAAGASRKAPDPTAEALRWLADHQHSAGYWRPQAFADDSKRSVAASGNIDHGASSDRGDAGQELFATSLALLAFVHCGHDHKEGASKETVRRALMWLRSTQRPDGGFGDKAVETLRNHATATQALCYAYGLSGDAVLKPIAMAAVERLRSNWNSEPGFAAAPDGGEKSLISLSAAVTALREAELSGLVETVSHEKRKVAALLPKLLFENKGALSVQLNAASDQHPPTSANAANPVLNAAWLTCHFFADGSVTDQSASLLAQALVADAALPVWEKGRVDLLHWQVASHATYQFGGEVGEKWFAALTKALHNRQRGFRPEDKDASATTLAEYGSFDAVDGSGGGRVIATARAILIAKRAKWWKQLSANLPANDKDGDAVGDAIDGLRAQQSSVPRGTQGQMLARREGEVVGEFPLKLTRVQAKVSGTVASTTVTQTFTNPYEGVIEAVYRFPLPGDAAINDFLMDCNGRRIRGMVRTRAEAQRVYNEARARGQTASLLTQEQANIFTQRVANIAVKEQVEVTITFFQTLACKDGRFEYVFPMVVGPRYTGGGATPKDRDGDGTEDGDDGLNAPQLPEGMRSGHDVRITVDIDAGLPLDMAKFQSVAHAVTLTATNTNRLIATLHPAETIANRDFVLRWSVAGAAPAVGMVTHREAGGGYFSLQMQPQLDARDADVTPREITFIMDVSGSMSGGPAQMCNEVMRKSLDRMRPDDLFNIVYFASGNAQLFETPAPVTPDNLERARRFLDSVKAGGGTEMLSALDRALDASHDPRRIQMYALLTDGYIGEVDGILKRVQQNKAARWFAFGIGSSVNRVLIDGVAEQGNGRAMYCLPREERFATEAADAFFGAIDSPVLCDIDLDWGDLPVADVMPRAPQDLFAAQPLVLHGRFTAEAKGVLKVRGRVGSRHVTYEVPVDMAKSESNPAIAAVWARQTIAQLESTRLNAQDTASIDTEITDIALRFNLASRTTSFVAVDESRVVGDGSPLRVFQPVEMPENIVLAGTDRPRGDSRSVRVPGWGLVAGETANGSVIVLKVEEGSAAARAGMRPGQVLRKVGGLAVQSLDSLEQTLNQAKAGAKTAVETELTDDGQVHRAGFELPDPAGE